MAKKLSKRDKGRIAQWGVVIEFSLASIRDELKAAGVHTGEVADALTRVDIALAEIRQRVGIEVGMENWWSGEGTAEAV